MDRRLTTAAQTGNVEFLFKLIEDDPLILHSVALAGGDTPLHIASMAGHLNFVQTIMNLREEFARELNQDGFSPLHIASANGYVEIVKELLRVDHNLCLFKGIERRIPLHYAALKGRVDVIKELLAASSQSVEEVTARGETALHLAVKNNQFDVLTILVEHLKHFKNEFVLNAKDEQGNTILHLAVCRKQYEVVESLLGENSVSKAVEEVNSLNNNGLTALDVLLLFQSEAGDREIEEILRRAGAMRARDLLTLAHASSSLNQNVAVNLSNGRPMPEQDPSSDEQLVDYLRFNKERDSPSDVRDTILVIAVLIFAATYEAGFSPPGGLWQEDSATHIAGRSVLATKRLYSYAFFLICNSIGLLASASVILTFAKGLPSEFGLRRAIAALSVTYGICLAVTAPDGYSIWIILSCSIAIPLIVLYGTSLARYYYLRWWKNTVQSRSQQSA